MNKVFPLLVIWTLISLGTALIVVVVMAVGVPWESVKWVFGPMLTIEMILIVGSIFSRRS